MFIAKRHNRAGWVDPRGSLDRKRFKKGGTSAPPTINAFDLGANQARSNVATAAAQAGLNNVNTASPFGSSTFEPYGQGPDGIGPAGYNLRNKLDPNVQGVFDAQTALAKYLAGAAGDVGRQAVAPAFGGANLINSALARLGEQVPTGPVDTSSLVGLPTSATDFSDEVRGAQDAAYNTQARYLDPQFKQRRGDLSQQLADQGISAGTDAYTRAQGDLGREEGLAYSGARDAATRAGDEEQARLFGENLGSRQQGFNELVTKWGQPLAALGSAAGIGSGILGGAVSALPGLGSLGEFAGTGTVPTTIGNTQISPANIVGAQGAANTAAANNFGSGFALNNQLFNGIGSLGGSLGFGNGGLGRTLGIGGSGGGGGLFSGLFGGGGAGAGSFSSLFPGATDIGAYIAANPEIALALL